MDPCFSGRRYDGDDGDHGYDGDHGDHDNKEKLENQDDADVCSSRGEGVFVIMLFIVGQSSSGDFLFRVF